MMTALRIAGWTNLAIGLLHIAARPWERRTSYWVGIGPDMDRLGRMHFLLPYALWIATAAAFGAFGLYTLSAAGSFRSLPFAKAAVFSTIALTIGVLYLVGAWSLFKEG